MIFVGIPTTLGNYAARIPITVPPRTPNIQMRIVILKVTEIPIINSPLYVDINFKTSVIS